MRASRRRPNRSRWRSSAAASSGPPWPGCSPSTPTTSPPGSAARSSSSASPCAAPARTARDLPVDPALFTTDAESLVTAGRHRHRGHRRHRAGQPLIGCAMKHGASVVSANKALLAEDGPDPVRRGRRARRRPLLRGRRRRRDPDPAPDARVARRRRRAQGPRASSTAPPTTSSTRWTRPGQGFAEAVEQAQALGYAEADPTADVEGFDAAAKAAILASLAFHTRVSSDRSTARASPR